MRICMLANARAVHTQRWAAAFAERGHEVHVVSIRSARIPDVTVHTVATWRADDTGVVPTLLGYVLLLVRARRILRDLDPDLVNPHFAITHGVIAAVAGVRPMVVTTWGRDVVWDGEGRMPRWRRFLLRQVFRRAAVTLVTSRFMEQSLSREYGADVTLRRVAVGVDVERFHPAQDRRPTTGVRIGFVKTLKPKYAPTDLLRAFAIVHEQEPATSLVMAGRGPLRSTCERLVDELGLRDHVELLGFVPNEQVADLLRSVDVLVNCSVDDSETFGVVVLEAAACAVPVVATDVGGVEETCLDGVNGILTPPGDVEQLAAAILELVRDPARRRSMGAAGRELVTTSYDWDDCVTRALTIYERVVADARATS